MSEHICKVCNIVCRDKYDMKRHLVTNKHLNKVIGISKPCVFSPTNSPYKCTICKKAYKYKSGLSKHMKNHMENQKDNPVETNTGVSVLEKFMQQQMLLIESQQEVMKKMNTIVDSKGSQHFHQNNGIINNKINSLVDIDLVQISVLAVLAFLSILLGVYPVLVIDVINSGSEQMVELYNVYQK